MTSILGYVWQLWGPKCLCTRSVTCICDQEDSFFSTSQSTGKTLVGHLWFEGTGDEKTINTNHPWSFGGELRGKLVYRAWHLVKSSINVSLFPYSPLTSCGSEIRIMLLRGRRGSEEERDTEAGRENCSEDNICFLFPRLGAPSRPPGVSFLHSI